MVIDIAARPEVQFVIDRIADSVLRGGIHHAAEKGISYPAVQTIWR